MEPFGLGTNCPTGNIPVYPKQDGSHLPWMEMESNAFMGVLQRLIDSGSYGDPGTTYLQKWEGSSDAGTFYQIAIMYNPEETASPTGYEFACAVQNDLPFDWDDEAVIELGTEFFDYIDSQD